ncbi:DUF2384 domain-containing protein [Sphingomonas parva]|uniref:DUF2384 domain-containing protein n=1 Tax=Sphingomonas parva TaxID=2555898 RepID=A0A4Y8ZUP6_9SPHN|nr:antitoxin Xre/MbcA/ParS toxin-binding domain-containing protein [Sphingomonas parva]TFI59753.1 DUF2384 domain-containing protein [Sphingomonas parva]
MTGRLEELHELRTVRSDWQALSSRWALTEGERVALLQDASEERPFPAAATEKRMRLILAVDRSLPIASHDREVLTWLRRPASLLGARTPLDVMAGAPCEIRAVRDLAERIFRQ